MKKVLACIFIFSLIGSSFAPFSSVSAEESNCNCKEPVSEEYFNEQGITPVKFQENNSDKEFNLSKEIAESQLEEKAIITKNGHVENFYRNAKAAGVSKDAFEKFENLLSEINKSVDLGEMTLGESIYDIKFSNSEENSGEMTIQASAVYSISHSQAVKAQKLIYAGAGIALVAAELGVPWIVASGLTLLATGIGLCDWNDRGFYLVQISSTQWNCIPK